MPWVSALHASWVKRWSQAMGFLQNVLKGEYFSHKICLGKFFKEIHRFTPKHITHQPKTHGGTPLKLLELQI